MPYEKLKFSEEEIELYKFLLEKPIEFKKTINEGLNIERTFTFYPTLIAKEVYYNKEKNTVVVIGTTMDYTYKFLIKAKLLEDNEQEISKEIYTAGKCLEKPWESYNLVFYTYNEADKLQNDIKEILYDQKASLDELKKGY